MSGGKKTEGRGRNGYLGGQVFVVRVSLDWLCVPTVDSKFSFSESSLIFNCVASLCGCGP